MRGTRQRLTSRNVGAGTITYAYDAVHHLMGVAADAATLLPCSEWDFRAVSQPLVFRSET